MGQRTQDCPRCGTTFTTEHSHQRYCTRVCNKRANYDYVPRRYVKTCRQCGKDFPSRNRAQLVCSPRCRNQWASQSRREENIARARAWASANPERFALRMAEARARRRARIQSAPRSAVTVTDLAKVKARQHGRCAYCHEARPLTLEHVVPLARGGSHSIGNLTWVCRSCNCSKGQKLLTEWRVWTSRLST